MAVAEQSDMTTNLVTENVRIFLSIKSAYNQCDSEIKEVIDEMIGVFSSEDATDDEKEAATFTIVEALFPSLAVDVLDHCERVRKSDHARARSTEMAEEERVFAERVQQRLTELGWTQKQLADKIGIGQPAICNMLSRQCRPQKRTVLKISEALNISPEHLWPGFEQSPNQA